MRPAFLVFLLAAFARAAAADNLAERVVLLANRDDPDSRRIAQHYAEVRGVPAANIIALPMSSAETIGWREFVITIWQPLLDELVRTKWIDAVPMELADSLGRRKFAPNGHRLAALVICRGVPLRIAHDPSLYAEVLPFTRRSEFRTNAGAVDAELSLLALPNYPVNAFLPNPLFQNREPTTFELAQVIKVARLDGPAAEDALALVDRAVTAERHGLLGRAYIDLSDRDPIGNRWLESTAQQLAELAFDLSVDHAPATLPMTARIDAPALYFGWYAGDLGGPFRLPGFKFPPGAIALHIHSYSAATLRSATTGWTGPFLARGVTATVGNVHEPYLQFTHRPDLLLRALARGATLVDAAYFSLPALSWQAILVGDPLYRPFAMPLDEQLKDRTKLPPRLAGYAVLRRMRELDAADRREEATALAISAQRETPCLAIAVALARRFRDAGDADAAASALGFASLAKSYRADEWAVAREAAHLLESCGRLARALDVWQVLLATETLPHELRLAWLPEGRAVALAAKDAAQASAWQHEITLLLAATQAN